jgi:hypothetical protein
MQAAHVDAALDERTVGSAAAVREQGDERMQRAGLEMHQTRIWRERSLTSNRAIGRYWTTGAPHDLAGHSEHTTDGIGALFVEGAARFQDGILIEPAPGEQERCWPR